MCGPNVIGNLRVKFQKRRAPERKSVEMQKRPLAARWRYPGQSQLATHRKARSCLPEELFILFRKFRGLRIPGHKEDSVRVPERAAGHLARSSSSTSGREDVHERWLRPAATQTSWNSVVGLGQSSPISLSCRRQREKSAACEAGAFRVSTIACQVVCGTSFWNRRKEGYVSGRRRINRAVNQHVFIWFSLQRRT